MAPMQTTEVAPTFAPAVGDFDVEPEPETMIPVSACVRARRYRDGTFVVDVTVTFRPGGQHFLFVEKTILPGTSYDTLDPSVFVGHVVIRRANNQVEREAAAGMSLTARYVSRPAEDGPVYEHVVIVPRVEEPGLIPAGVIFTACKVKERNH